jgi:hypothetical protein
MRHTHKHSPFHRIECWTGDAYRRGSLWEVGTYILTPHDGPEPFCAGLAFQINHLERLQKENDDREQLKLGHLTQRWSSGLPGSAASASEAVPDCQMTEEGDTEKPETWEQEVMSDAEFHKWLDNLHEQSGQDELMDGDDAEDGERGEQDVEHVYPYLGANKEAGADDAGATDPTQSGPGVDMSWSMPQRPATDGLNNTYVRAFDINGIHHLAMVTCNCHGQEKVALDLVACRLLPASFTRIRTVFTASLMDYFRLCNLELKASAYQFYNLIRRLTRPLGNSEIVNLYNEFRRMSRLWRWMKKLKWAGYGHNQQKPENAPPGSLAIFCPTCPQPGRNLPGDWKTDRNRWVYRVVVAADGNFHADHVRQKKNDDFWLIDGGGMFPKRDDYFSFLAQAIEKFTVRFCVQFCPRPSLAELRPLPMPMPDFRKPPVKTHSVPSRTHYLHPRPAISPALSRFVVPGMAALCRMPLLIC